MILYLNTHIYNNKKGNGAESSPVVACIGGTGRLVSQDEMRCVWRTGREQEEPGEGASFPITTWKDLQAWKTISKAWKSDCPALGGVSYKSETRHQS